jgi:hypothetical protein
LLGWTATTATRWPAARFYSAARRAVDSSWLAGACATSVAASAPSITCVLASNSHKQQSTAHSMQAACESASQHGQ